MKMGKLKVENVAKKAKTKVNFPKKMIKLRPKMLQKRQKWSELRVIFSWKWKTGKIKVQNVAKKPKTFDNWSKNRGQFSIKMRNIQSISFQFRFIKCPISARNNNPHQLLAKDIQEDVLVRSIDLEFLLMASIIWVSWAHAESAAAAAKREDMTWGCKSVRFCVKSWLPL